MTRIKIGKWDFSDKDVGKVEQKTRDLDVDLIDEIAPIAYGIQRQYARALGDKTFVSWHDLSAGMRDSVRIGVRHVLNNNHATPRDLHALWRRTREDEGWTLDPVKDLDKRTSPFLVEYDELPQLIMLKNVIFHATVCLLAGIDMPDEDVGVDPVDE